MIDIRAHFDERLLEVDAFIRLIAGIEHLAQSGTPFLQTRSGESFRVDPLQQRLLYGSVYVHLYSLVESTISRCVAAVEQAASERQCVPWDLSHRMRMEWVRSIARTHETLNTENRLESAIALCEHLVQMLPVALEIERGGGGNWDDDEIQRFAKRLGVELPISDEARVGVKRPFRDNKGALKLIKFLRNKLAHGEISFSECGEGLSVDRLEELKRYTVAYLSEVIGCFERFIRQHEFLQPEKRPAAGGG